MTKWEYKFIVMDLPTGEYDPTKEGEDDHLDVNIGSLNAEGDDGWEVVSLVPRMGAGNSYTFALLKRPKRVKATVRGSLAKL
jgi:hypothetical protein